MSLTGQGIRIRGWSGHAGEEMESNVRRGDLIEAGVGGSRGGKNECN